MEMIAKIALCLFVTLAITAAKPTPKFTMPTSCSNSVYCTEKHEFYPEKEVYEVLQAANFTFTNGETVGYREGVQGEERDCEAITSDDLIYEIVDNNGDVRVVVQSETGFRQQVTIERCQKPGHIDYSTKHFSLETVRKYNLHCMEQTLDLSFIVLSKDWSSIEMVRPKSGIPVRCECRFFKK